MIRPAAFSVTLAPRARRPADLSLPAATIDRPKQLRLHSRQQQIVVIAEPPTEPPDLKGLQGFFAPFRSDRRQQPLLQRLGGLDS